LSFGSPMTTAEMFQRAVAKFDTAMTVPGITAEFTNLAKVGKGRALLDLGQYAAAAAAVSGVPDNFAYLIQSSANTTREANGVWWFQYVIARLGLSNSEGKNGLDYISSHDPRIPVVVPTDSKGTQQLGQDGSTPLFEQAKYPDRDSDVPLATGIEARLIEAEAAMQAGDNTTFLTKLNAARAQAVASVEAVSGDTTSLPALTAADVPADQAGKVNLLFRERAFDMWLTAHRLGDLRRLIRQYGRTADQVFPTGAWFKGGAYGDDVSMPVPQHEANNPNFTQCDPTVP
ncbi:MAG TPA: RagB/SusD family nutrient uptake outer membrane protein, partial [Gemmatimonadaceae bacterium]|nr:RagB/SusD family nutrient uptake outer membrane protein [Gemmatimonadaceae bacterium]